ncbi:tol-pal system protein YbgF [Delftia sp. PS-11]|uniref:tol-pal system protein YbgF n=1 Tax=Delftia sp. PS-11 TaxID=2767222 RepID=UPI0024557CD3|nr:tol-pal system protein YbgF [Delftia sp. PS-11]KAJ8744570.1 tol-pal system protein YbgF [Delftia sp. PS-11]
MNMLRSPILHRTALRTLLAAGLLTGYACSGHAALFGDDEARRAILEMRQRVDSVQQTQQRMSEESAQTRRSMLELQSQIEQLKSEQAKLRGQNEQLLRDVAELQRGQRDIAKGVDERLRQFEPVTVTVDGQEFAADPNEKRDFEAALAKFRSGSFPEAATAFASFMGQWPKSGYGPSARFWLGNAQYAARSYKEAMANFRILLNGSPMHARAPEAALAIANCQIELKDTKAARKTLEDLIKAYPNSEAASAGKNRLASLK